MEMLLNIEPTQRSIHFVDQTINTFTETYEIPNEREICFIVHELVINAIEAMQQMQFTEMKEIAVHVIKAADVLKVTVTDGATGIPKENWNGILETNFDEVDYSDRGRGFLFIKHMVDEIWFENLSHNRFLVGIKKKLNR